jgi:uncharacterized protein (TIGR02145 family)
MTENFAFKPIIGNFWAYDNNPSNIIKYGYLYDWKTAKRIAAKGWHLPTIEEWNILYEFLGAHWEKVHDALKEGGSSGFNALLGGEYDDYSDFFSSINMSAGFWSATDYYGKSRAKYVEGGLGVIVGYRAEGHSVRLFRD